MLSPGIVIISLVIVFLVYTVGYTNGKSLKDKITQENIKRVNEQAKLINQWYQSLTSREQLLKKGWTNLDRAVGKFEKIVQEAQMAANNKQKE